MGVICSETYIEDPEVNRHSFVFFDGSGPLSLARGYAPIGLGDIIHPPAQTETNDVEGLAAATAGFPAPTSPADPGPSS